MMHLPNQLAVATTTQSRRTVNIQNGMGHCCQDVACGLVQMTTTLENIQIHNLSVPNILSSLESKDVSSLSGISVPDGLQAEHTDTL